MVQGVCRCVLRSRFVSRRNGWEEVEGVRDVVERMRMLRVVWSRKWCNFGNLDGLYRELFNSR